MALYEPSSHWWSDILQTEFRMPLKRDSGVGILPPRHPRNRFGPKAAARMMRKHILARFRRFFACQPPTATSVCANPEEAYMHACIAATFFCYVSPELYCLTETMDKQGALEMDQPYGDDL